MVVGIAELRCRRIRKFRRDCTGCSGEGGISPHFVCMPYLSKSTTHWVSWNQIFVKMSKYWIVRFELGSIEKSAFLNPGRSLSPQFEKYPLLWSFSSSISVGDVVKDIFRTSSGVQKSGYLAALRRSSQCGLIECWLLIGSTMSSTFPI